MQSWLLIREANLWPGHQALWAVPPVLEGVLYSMPPSVWRPSWLACQPGKPFWYIPNPVLGNEVICHGSTLWGLGCVSFKAPGSEQAEPYSPPAHSARGKDAILLGDMF